VSEKETTIFAKARLSLQALLKRQRTPTEKEAYTPTAEIATMPLAEKKTHEIKVSLETSLELPQLVAGCGQSIGRQREHNEDAVFTLTTMLASDNTQIPFGLYIVADGMGGHQHGEIASGVAARAMASHIISRVYLPLFSLPAEPPTDSLQEIMQEGILEAHRAILKHAPGGGTTLTAAIMIGNQMTIAHVGDSRAYTVHPDGFMQPLTRDHSLVKRLEELGQITSEEAAIHPQRNVLYRALGQGEPFEPEVGTFPLTHSGYLLICTDGLWGSVPEAKISEIILANPILEVACQKLLDAANEAGGPDNISAILVKMPD